MARAGETIGNRIAPPRFVLFGTLLIGGFLLWRAAYPAASWQDALIIAFDLAAALFLLSLAPLMKGFAVTDMRRHADENDANRTLILLVATVLAGAATPMDLVFADPPYDVPAGEIEAVVSLLARHG